MRIDLAAARRRAAVRAVARDWEKAGIIDAPARAAIDAKWPDDRVSRGPVWRVLIFLFVSVIASSVEGIAFAVLRPRSEDGIAALLLVFAGVLAAATEHLQGPRRFDGTGAEAATSFLALASAAGAVAIFLFGHDRVINPGWPLLVGAVLSLAAWRRWGFAIYPLFGSAGLLFALARLFPQPRLAWTVAAAALLGAAAIRGPRSDDPAGWSMISAAALAAAYAALNVWSWDGRLLEALHSGTLAPPRFPGARLLAIAATALFPAAVLAWGLLRRRRLMIDLGLAFAALSLVTLRAYVRLGPLWLVLAEAGALAVVLALAAERWLDAGAARERNGLTADPLFEDERQVRAVSAAATVLALAPDARPAPAAAELRPGGGSYGGGGATGDF